MTRIIKCSECGNNIGSGSFLNDGQNCKTCERERDKRDLEQKINSYQYSLRRIKSMRNHPSYDEYQVQELERQLAEAEAEYREKYVKKALANYPLQLQQANALIFCQEDEYKPLSILNRFNKEHADIKRFQVGIYEQKIVESNMLEK
ncbi:10713_t:CDS:2 [Funneliformis geosporum]|uniref:10713_t:CDS:1 n=1 Tax=Funneliformis geosporum TaxID=1117311 RepID=A0A9W4WPK8_9GLOM|nr:10713_t:CDS:2 [Funneliformis geosporum]